MSVVMQTELYGIRYQSVTTPKRNRKYMNADTLQHCVEINRNKAPTPPRWRGVNDLLLWHNSGIRELQGSLSSKGYPIDQ